CVREHGIQLPFDERRPRQMLEQRGHQETAAMKIPAVRERYLTSDVDVHASIVGPGNRRAGGNRAENDGDRHEVEEGSLHDCTDVSAGRSHTHAAPRTPLESPCRARSRRVRTRSEKMCGSQSDGTRSYRRSMFDTPPPSTMTWGSMTLMMLASARA